MSKTVVFDFDGVIHSYTSGWQGVDNIPDQPVPGIREAICDLRDAGYRVVVVSTRCSDPNGELQLQSCSKLNLIFWQIASASLWKMMAPLAEKTMQIG